MMTPFSWGSLTPAFLDELAAWISDRRALEIFAGNGLLAHELSGRGVDVVATTLFSGHDRHDEGMHTDVIEMDASAAVLTYGQHCDVLVACWPTADESMLRAVRAWGDGRPIVFIGEMPKPDWGFAGLAGCASDAFFDATAVEHVFSTFEPRNMLERAVVLRFKP